MRSTGAQRFARTQVRIDSSTVGSSTASSADSVRMAAAAGDWSLSSIAALQPLLLSSRSFLEGRSHTMASETVLATAGGEEVHIWHLGKTLDDSAAPSTSLPPLAGGATALAWSSVSNALAAASARGSISLFSLAGAPLESMASTDGVGEAERVRCLAFAGQSLDLCSGGSSAELKIWDCKRQAVVKTYAGHASAITSCAYGDKDMLLASGSSSGDILVHTTAGLPSDEPQRIKTGAGGSSTAIRTVKFSPFRRSHLASAGEEALVEYYDTARSDAPSLARFTQHTGTVTGLAFSPVNELLLCSAGLDCKALFYDVQAKKLVKSVTCEAPVCSLDFMNDGFTVAVGTQNGKVLIYDLRALGSGGVPKISFMAHPGSHVSCTTFQHLPSKSAKGKPKVIGKENAKPAKSAATAAGDPAPAAATSAGTPRERAAAPETTAAPAVSPDSAMTAEDLRRVHAKRSEEERMKDTFAITHDSPARHAAPRTTLAELEARRRMLAAGTATSEDSDVAAATHKSSRTSSRESLLGDLEKIRKDRAIEEERLRLSRGSLGGGSSTPLRGGDAALPPPHSGEKSTHVVAAAGAGSVGAVGSSALGSSFSPLAASHAGAGATSASAAAITQRMPNLAQGDLHDGQDVVPPAPSSARKLPPTPGGAGRREGAQQPQSPAVSRNIFALHNAGNTADGAGSEAGGQYGGLSDGAGALPRDLVPIIQAAVENSMASVKDALREDVQNLHLDMIRQFHLQQAETRSLLQTQWQQNRDLQEEVVRLREELSLLKYIY